MTSVVRRILFPFAHENVVKKWIDKKLSHVVVDVVVDAKFTEGALELIKGKSEKEFAVLITLDHILVRSRRERYCCQVPK